MFDISPHTQFLNAKEHADALPFEAINTYANRMSKESDPEDSPTALEETIVQLQAIPPFIDVNGWLVWSPDQEDIIAVGHVGIFGEAIEHNQHLAQFELSVLPHMRRQGIATQLLKRIADLAAANHKRLLMTNTDSAIPAGDAFMKRLGAHMAFTVETHQLDLADLDPELMQAWQSRAQERASDFELGVWEGPYPEEDIPYILAMKEVMNTAPRDDLDVEDFTWTAEQLRQVEESMLQRSVERWTMYARHRETGEIAGYTEVFWNFHQPERLGQGDTAVFPRHRHHGIGRWLKAAMVKRVLRERPQVKRIRTGTAASNAPMLKVNREMGFQLYKTQSAWQVELVTVKAYLETAAGTVETNQKRVGSNRV